ncbi:MAG: UDP-N-acetylmuramoyl-L-alanyl-D-glutamate--2,6-diaminopimelate ligase [bacterium]|nr:UDP-N-acetylmuramoyl-L-alanyl-D-glutamate--2,6-diaminopimelate ligase [bacterium]
MILLYHIKNLKIKRRIITTLAALHFFGNPSKKMKVVGVTGTNGKTTTATLLYRIATSLGHKAGLISTVENIIVKEVRGATHTTPDSVTLSKLLHEMAEKGCEYVFMEVSSHALDQNRVAGITFAGGIFTNLTHDHLDYHKTMDRYFSAKKKFFDMLPESAFALSNADDDHGKKMLEGIKARKFLYEFKNIDGPATLYDAFRGELISSHFSGLEIKLGDTIIKSWLLGKFNAYNLLTVWAASNLLGFDMKKVNEILTTIEPPRGRFEHFISPKGVLVIVDYAHTPDALEKVLLVARDLKQEGKKLISVFGCGGDRDPTKRAKMGSIGATLSDIAIFTSDNPRSEDPNKIIVQMKSDLLPGLIEKIKSIPNRREAIAESMKLAQSGDIILCAGKGHETYQEIKGVKNHFNDVEEFQKVF